MSDLLIDVRCLQDPNYAPRGIGRHALALLQHARETPAIAACRLVGLIDPALPALIEPARHLLEAVQPTASSGANPVAFIQLSPMTHDPLFVGRLLTDPAIPSAAVIYDFIPLDEPKRYLPSAAQRIDYHLNLRWLARYQHFLPISADAAHRLHGLLHTAPAEITITGAPLNANFEQLRSEIPRSHILVVGGGDPRKNPEFTLAAHRLSRSGLPVIITGSYPPNHFPGAGQPGHVSEAALFQLYQGAACVIASSRAEGFSLPIIEAMAAGTPVLASDIPAHAELVDPTRLFPLTNPEALATLISQIQNADFCTQAIAHQDQVWPRFRAAAVAGRAWRAIADLLIPLPIPSIGRGRRPRIAILTPLPPDRSGVADYSAAMCPALGARVDIDIFTPTDAAPKPEGVRGMAALSDLPLLSPQYDRVISVLGNSHFHWDILSKLLRYGGACIAHDGRMLDIYNAKIGLTHTTALAEQELSRKLQPNEMAHWLSGLTPPGALLYNEIAAAAAPLILHSRSAATAIAARTGTKPVHLPFCIYRRFTSGPELQAQRLKARRRLEGLGAKPGDKIISTFGFVSASKAPEDCLWTLSLLRQWRIPARLHFVGDAMGDQARVQVLTRKLGLEEHVWFSGGFVDECVWQDHLLGSDAALQLRLTGTGSVSGALSDCAGAGLPAVASAVLADAIDAPSYMVSVPDHPSPVLVAEALATLLANPPNPAHHEACRQLYAREHSFPRYVHELCQALALI